MIKAVTLSRKGEKSDQNEDACVALPSLGVFVVADGVGGNPAGEQASRDVVDTLYSELRIGEITRGLIHKAIDKANASVYQKSEEPERAKGMASTLVLAWVADSKLMCFSVGDSRIFRFRGDQAAQLTKDHIKTVQKASGPKNLVTKVMGVKAQVEPDITEWDWADGDVLLLVSDGISDQVPDEIMTKIITHKEISMSDKAKMLVDESERRGGRDDKTVVLAF